MPLDRQNPNTILARVDSTGSVREDNAALLGAFFVNGMQQAAMSRVASPLLRVVGGIDGDLAFAVVVAFAAERAVDPHVLAAAGDVELHAALGGGFFERAFSLERIEAYQDSLLASWKRAGRRFPEPRLRVPFLTTSAEHEYHFLSLARELARNPDRHLFYAATLDEYLQDTNPLTSSILLDHDGRWQALVNLHPSAFFQREPVQLPRQNVAPLLAV